MLKQPYWIPRLEEEKIRVAFVVQHASAWPAMISTVSTAFNRLNFHSEVILSPFIHPFSSVEQIKIDLDSAAACLAESGVSFVHSNDYDPLRARPHVIFIPNPYEQTRPDHLRTHYLKSIGIRPVYVPYGLEMGGGTWNTNAQFNETIHNEAWRIFSRSERHKSMFSKYCGVGDSHVVVTGHPKFDLQQNKIQCESSEINSILKKANGRKIVLWTPHFSAGAVPEWSTFKQYGLFIMDEINRHPELFLVARPHPLFFTYFISKDVWTKKDEDDFRATILTSNNIALDESINHNEVFKISHALMADVGSFLLEYLPTGKPLLYLDLANGLGLNDDGIELIKYLYRAESKIDIVEFFDMLANNSDHLELMRNSIVNDFLAGLETNIGESICKEIDKL